MTRTTKMPRNPSGDLESTVELTPDSGIGRSIRMFRASEGLTQGDLERMTGVNRANLSAYETGQRRPRPATVARIMAVVGSRPPRPSRLAAAAVESLAERVRAVAEAALAEVATRLTAGLPLSLSNVTRPASAPSGVRSGG